MRIVITFPSSHTSPGGGARSCLQIARHLEKLGAEVMLMPVSTQPASMLENSNIPVRPIAPNRYRLHYFLNAIPIMREIKRIEKENHIDAVLSWDFESALLCSFLEEKKIVFGMIAAYPSYQELMNRSGKNRLIVGAANNWFRWRLLRAADVVFVSSNYTRQELIRLVGVSSEQTAITYRGIDPIFSQVNRTPSADISRFIFFGSLAPIKGVLDTVKALGIVAKKGYCNWNLRIAGWGDDTEVKQMVRENDIEDRVSLLGTLDPKDLVKELAWANLAILPSQAESFGRSIAEAQAVGLPVVSYDSGSIPEILKAGETGWIVPALQVESLADAIIEAINCPSEAIQMGEAGRKRVNQKFSWEKTASVVLHEIEAAKQKVAC